MPDIFNFSDPNTMGLLGAMAGLGEAAMPSRMPVPIGAVLGKAASGLAQGAQAAQAYQKAQQENALQKLTLQGWQNYMNAMGGQQSPQQPQGAPQAPQIPQVVQTPNQSSIAPSGLDLSKLSPAEQAYLARKDPTAFSNGVQNFQQSSIQANNPPLPPGVKTPIPAGMSSGQGQAALDPLAMLSQARAGMFPGGPGAAMFGPAASLYEKTLGQGYQGVRMPDGSLGVSPLNGIDRVRYMLANNEALGKGMGEKQQQFDAQGNIVPMAGSLESAKQSAYAGEYGKSQGGLPAELTKIGAQGSETRRNEAYKTALENANTTVSVPDGMGGTKLMLRGDANAIAQQNSAPPLPETLDAKDMVSKSTGTVIPAPKGQIPMKIGSAPNPEWIKEEQSWSSTLPMNYQTEQKLLTLGNALKMTQSGMWADHKADVYAAMKALHIPISNSMQNDVSAVQTIIHENMLSTLGTLKETMAGTGSRMTQMEFDRISKAMTNAGIQPEANQQILAEAIGTLRQNRALVNSWQEAKTSGWSNPFAYQQSWLAKNPTSGFVEQSRSDLGPLKGMTGAKPPAPGIPQAAIDHLKTHPELANHFDAKYGAGSSKTVLGGQ